MVLSCIICFLVGKSVDFPKKHIYEIDTQYIDVKRGKGMGAVLLSAHSVDRGEYIKDRYRGVYCIYAGVYCIYIGIYGEGGDF